MMYGTPERYQVTWRDRFVCAVSNFLINRVASPKYHIFLVTVWRMGVANFDAEFDKVMKMVEDERGVWGDG